MLDLTQYTADGEIRHLSGKDRGLSVRTEFDMNTLDAQDDTVTVRIPDYVYAISTSFFCGMFGKSYERLGGRGPLLKKYTFDIPSRLWPQIDQGLERCALQCELLVSNAS